MNLGEKYSQLVCQARIGQKLSYWGPGVPAELGSHFQLIHSQCLWQTCYSVPRFSGVVCMSGVASLESKSLLVILMLYFFPLFLYLLTCLSLTKLSHVTLLCPEQNVPVWGSGDKIGSWWFFARAGGHGSEHI